MKLFQYCYDKSMIWVRHKNATTYLAGMSFAESMFFPIPPDVMLAPMSLANTERAWFFAMVTTVASILGGICGYLLGLFAFESLIQPWFESMGYIDKLNTSINWFERYGVWVVFLAGFSPIPYKIFTISAGFLQMAFLPFLFASAIGRGARFFLVAALMRWGGARMEQKLRDYIDVIGWVTIALAVITYFILR